MHAHTSVDQYELQIDGASMATLLVSAMSLGGPGLRANLPENGLVLWQTIASESATVVLLQSSMVWNTVYVVGSSM